MSWAEWTDEGEGSSSMTDAIVTGYFGSFPNTTSLETICLLSSPIWGVAVLTRFLIIGLLSGELPNTDRMADEISQLKETVAALSKEVTRLNGTISLAPNI